MAKKYKEHLTKLLFLGISAVLILLIISSSLRAHLCDQATCFAQPVLGRCSLEQFNALTGALNTLFTAAIAGIAGIYTLWAASRANEEKEEEITRASRERETDKNNMIDRKIAEYTRQLLEFNTIQIQYPEIMQVFRDEHGRYDASKPGYKTSYGNHAGWIEHLSKTKKMKDDREKMRLGVKTILSSSDFFEWPRALNHAEHEEQLLKTRAKSYIYKRMNFFDEIVSLANPESTDPESNAIRIKMEFSDWETFIRVRMSNPLYLEVWLGESAIFGEKFNTWMDQNLYKIIEHTGDPKHRYLY